MHVKNNALATYRCGQHGDGRLLECPRECFWLPMTFTVMDLWCCKSRAHANAAATSSPLLLLGSNLSMHFPLHIVKSGHHSYLILAKNLVTKCTKDIYTNFSTHKINTLDITFLNLTIVKPLKNYVVVV